MLHPGLGPFLGHLSSSVDPLPQAQSTGLVWDRGTEEEGEWERDSEGGEKAQDSRPGAPKWEHGVVCSLSVEPVVRSRLSVREEATGGHHLPAVK